MSLLTAGSLATYVAWRSMNAYQSYKINGKITYGNMWEIVFSILMSYWLIIPSVLFLIAKVIDGLFALALGGYLYIAPGPEEFIKDRGKVINGYWGYTITDMGICFACFILSLLGVLNG
tara:strand:+ start:208 stop:564 length:357 start_codon:yes stop_codon:yes gene_type:complete